MVIVAVAGGTGNVGRTIVEVLRQTKEHQVIVLSRSVSLEANSMKRVPSSN
jgi:NAD dependent epimerase/dehydratase family enzyme